MPVRSKENMLEYVTSMPVYTKHKRAYHDYTFVDTLEAGLVLSGNETKAIRAGHIQLKGAYVSVRGEEAWLVGAHISRYKYAAMDQLYEPTQSRKLLLKKKEIAYLKGKLQEKGLTIVPLSVYTSGPHIKLEIGIGKGKKQYDKRHSLKKKDIERDIRKDLKGRV